MSIAEFVRILGRGPGRSRSLTFEEAHEAMTRVCAGDAAPEALGAMLMLMRMKGETADEIAGFTQALRADCLTVPKPDLDWPSYAAGRTRGLPLFLLSARLVAQAGFTVLLHGWNGLSTSGPRVREGLAGAKIATATTPADIESTLARDGLAYVPLEDLSPVTLSLIKMRTDFGLRSCVNTVARMLNPGSADAALQGVFHPPYLELQMDAASALGQKNLSIVKGGGGEFEVNPSKDIRCFGLRDGAQFNDGGCVCGSGRDFNGGLGTQNARCCGS